VQLWNKFHGVLLWDVQLAHEPVLRDDLLHPIPLDLLKVPVHGPVPMATDQLSEPSAAHYITRINAPSIQPVGLARGEVQRDGRDEVQCVRRYEVREPIRWQCSLRESRIGECARVQGDRGDLGILYSVADSVFASLSQDGRVRGYAPIAMNSVKRPSANLLVP
jgi:hypothetical protein